MNDKITLTREQWNTITRYLIWTESYRKNEIKVQESIVQNYPDAPELKEHLKRWQEMDEELDKLLCNGPMPF